VPVLPKLRMRWRLALVALYLAVILPLLLVNNVGLTPDALVFIFFGAALLIGRPILFLRDWGVFFLIVILWQQTGPVATWAGFPLHLSFLVDADRAMVRPWLHGVLPQVWLQQRLFHGHWQIFCYDHCRVALTSVHWQWYDVMSWAVYALHFPEPLIVGFVIWLRTRAGFRRYATAYLVLAGLAFIGYIVYPAIPPWMAAHPYYAQRYHFHPIPLVGNMFDAFNNQVLVGQLGHRYTQVLHVSYNLTAAMPSLHAAFPLLSALYLRQTLGHWGLAMLGYALLVWFAVVYMAEHWMIDVVAGLGCAVVSYALVEGVAWAWAAHAGRKEATSAARSAALSAKAGRGR
jgi:PAP2 superfamily